MLHKSKTIIHHIKSGEYFRGWTKGQYLYFSVLVGLIIIATVISSSFSRDDGTYIRMIDRYAATGWGKLGVEIFQRELFILVLIKTLNSLGLGYIFLFLVHAVISLSIKFYLFSRYSKNIIISLAFFLSHFFILHDSTQIRFGMAIAFVYLALSFLANNQRLVFALMVSLSAVFFHFASFAFIAMLFLNGKRSMMLLSGLIALAVSLYFVDFRAVLLETVFPALSDSVINSPLTQKILFYIQQHNVDARFGLFNWRALPVYLSAIVLFRYRNVFSEYELLCFKSLLLSIFVYIMLKDITEVQYRLSGLFGFSLVFLMPYIHKWLSNKIGIRSAYIIMMSFFVLYFIKFAFYDKMIVI